MGLKAIDPLFLPPPPLPTGQGAEYLLYPTAIGSEPADPAADTMRHWQTCMRGHAAANLVPVVASNRIGTEVPPPGAIVHSAAGITFYGSSFIAGASGELVAEASRDGEAVLVAEFDLEALDRQRAAWGVFRDRRPELYGALMTLDGHTRHAAYGPRPGGA